MSRRYASRRYAGGLGPSRIRTRIPTTRQLGQWVSLRKTLRFRVRLQLSQSRCLSLLLAMSGRVFLFLPPRGHEPPPTLRDRLNSIIPGRNPPSCCTFTLLIAMQGHQTKTKQKRFEYIINMFIIMYSDNSSSTLIQ